MRSAQISIRAFQVDKISDAENRAALFAGNYPKLSVSNSSKLFQGEIFDEQ